MIAEIMKAKGGARAIATMTYDDGLKNTALTLDELCEKYGCRATLALTTHRLNDETVGFWRDIFRRGRLVPMSHSTTHAYLTKSHPENLTEEMITSEIEGSLETLKKYFPEYHVLSFALPYGSYAEEAFEHLYKSVYLSRAGVCRLYNESHRGMMQSLDPIPGSNKAGGWYAPVGVRMMPEKPIYTMITPEALIEYLDDCVRDGGWFLSTAHGIVEGENLDIKVEDLERIMKRMREHADRGDLWIADVNEVTKYIRERQNTEITVEGEGDDYTVTLAMAEMTADNLPLPTEIFNYPLTVRLELPDNAKCVSYTKGGEEYISDSFSLDGKTYAYIEMKPNETSEVAIAY